VPLRPEGANAAEGQPVKITGIEGSTPDARALAEAAEPPREAEPVAEAVAAVERAEEATTTRPPVVRFSRAVPYVAPAVDSYSLRLIAHRKLYDLGTLLQHAPSIAALTPGSTLLVNPYDLDRLGVSDGGRVKMTSPRATLTVEAHASTTIPKGSAALTVNQPGPDPADLIDATQPVTDIRIETL
jgi:anaerobic selenocysteine-containing dehydrogenase